MRFARRVFLGAGVYGLVVLLPQYFLEDRIGHDYPPPITHPENFYGFVGTALVWQLVFLLISTDPKRFRPIMPVAVLEKAAFAVPAAILFWQSRIAAPVFGFGMIDLLLGALFTIAFLRTAA